MKLLSNRAYNELKETASLSEERVEELTKELAWAKKGLYDTNKLLKPQRKPTCFNRRMNLVNNFIDIFGGLK